MGINIPYDVGVLLIILCTIVTNVNSYSKYGRSCGDIGCLPSEVCVIAHESCNYGQRDGKDCGSYPTCTKTGSSSGSKSTAGAKLNPAPDNTRISSSSSSNINNPSSINSFNPNPPNPHYVFGTPQNPQPPIYPNVPIFPHIQPTSPPPFQQFPQANHPSYPGQVAPRTPSTFNSPYIFGHQPTYYYPHPAASTRSPSLLQLLTYDQNRHRNSAFGQIHMGRHHYHYNTIIVSILTSFITLLLTFNYHRYDMLNSSSSSHSSSLNTNSNTPHSSYGGIGGGYSNPTSGGSHIYPQLPPSNPVPSAPNYPTTNGGGAHGGYPAGGYVPQHGGSGGYQPYGGGAGGYSGGGAYGGSGGYGGNAGGYGGGAYGGGGYGGAGQHGGSGGYNPNGGQPQKDKEGGFFTNILSNPVVSQAISNVIQGQIQKALQGGGSGSTNPQQPPYQGGYGGAGTYGSGGSGSSSGGSSALNFLGGLLANSGSNQPPKQNSGSSLAFLGDLLSNSGSSGTGGYGRGSSSTSGSGGLSDIFSSRQFGGLFSENPSSGSSASSQSASSSTGAKSYPTQAPLTGSYGSYGR